MISNISFCCFPVLLLLLNLAGAKPLLSDLQSLQQLLEEDERNNVPFYAASDEEIQGLGKNNNLNAAEDKSVFGDEDEEMEGQQQQQQQQQQQHHHLLPRWESAGDAANSAPLQPASGRQSLLARLLQDLARTSKRSWGSRYKKGGMRSCFGVRLDRIGSFSGLGC